MVLLLWSVWDTPAEARLAIMVNEAFAYGLWRGGVGLLGKLYTWYHYAYALITLSRASCLLLERLYSITHALAIFPFPQQPLRLYLERKHIQTIRKNSSPSYRGREVQQFDLLATTTREWWSRKLIPFKCTRAIRVAMIRGLRVVSEATPRRSNARRYQCLVYCLSKNQPHGCLTMAVKPAYVVDLF